MLIQENYSRILIEIVDGIATLTLNRPDALNAVDDTMHSELSRIFDDAQLDPNVRVVILTGAGKAFSSGGDTSAERAYSSDSGLSVIQEASRIIRHLIDLDKPLIAAVNGHAVGLGATLATLADISIVARGARLGDPHVRVALPAGNGSGIIWPLLIGVNRAKELLMLGDIITAEDAQALGLISRVVEADVVLTEARNLAARLVAIPPQAVRGTKASINGLLRMVANTLLPASLAIEELAMRDPAFRQALQALEEGKK